jgi:hypothetical protein
MRVVVRAVVLLAVFVGVWWVVAREVTTHAVAGGAPVAEVRLSGEMAGLFAGGLAVVAVGIAMVWRR